MQPLHRIIAQYFLNNGIPLSKSQHVDHIQHADGTHIQDRVDNLRITTHQGNHQNRKGGTSIYPGVSWDTKSNKYRVRLWINKKQVYLGLFADEREAALKYISGCIEYGIEYTKALEIYNANK